jgi:hypothetical protein
MGGADYGAILDKRQRRLSPSAADRLCRQIANDQAGEIIMKKQVKPVKKTRRRRGVAADLTGKRFGKWMVLKYIGQRMYYSPAGQKFPYRVWLCRCDCGAEKEVRHSNLTGGLSTKCQECCRPRHGMSSTKIYAVWENLRGKEKLPPDWEDFDAFRKAVGDPPDPGAHLTRYDFAKRHSAENTFWMLSTLSPQELAQLKQIRKKFKAQSREERVSQDKALAKIRTATSLKERNRHMVAARRSGHTFAAIAAAARITPQRVQMLLAALRRKREIPRR